MDRRQLLFLRGLFAVVLGVAAVQWILIWPYLFASEESPKNRYASTLASPTSPTSSATTTTDEGRMNAAVVVLCRNSDLEAIAETLRVFERRFNARFRYPYVMLNDQPFTSHFMRTLNQTLADTSSTLTTSTSIPLIYYGQVPAEHWGYPDWINRTRAAQVRAEMAAEGVSYGGSESYRFMCRYQSGFFFRHPLLARFDYYWRVEPETRLLCDVPEDPFVQMHQQQAKYGFTQTLPEFPATVRSLWKHTLDFAQQRRSSIQPSSHSLVEEPSLRPAWNPSLLAFFESYSGDYNLCHFWSNFEIGSLAFLRSQDYLDYFDYLDRAGGFFYERWGDAPVHSLAAGLFLDKSEVLFYDQIGYFHPNLVHCPTRASLMHNCECSRWNAFDYNPYSCLLQWQLYQPRSWF